MTREDKAWNLSDGDGYFLSNEAAEMQKIRETWHNEKRFLEGYDDGYAKCREEYDARIDGAIDDMETLSKNLIKSGCSNEVLGVVVVFQVALEGLKNGQS